MAWEYRVIDQDKNPVGERDGLCQFEEGLDLVRYDGNVTLQQRNVNSGLIWNRTWHRVPLA